MCKSNDRICHYKERLVELIKNESSALLDFVKFFQQGASLQECLTVHKLKQTIRENFNNLYRLDYHDDRQWKQYSDFDEVTQSYTFYPSKLNAHFRNQFKFLDHMSQTQLFLEYLQKKKNPATKMTIDRPEAIFIVDWLSFKWRRRNLFYLFPRWGLYT